MVAGEATNLLVELLGLRTHWLGRPWLGFYLDLVGEGLPLVTFLVNLLLSIAVELHPQAAVGLQLAACLVLLVDVDWRITPKILLEIGANFRAVLPSKRYKIEAV